MLGWKRARRVVLLLTVPLVLAACVNDNGQNSLSPKGPTAKTISNLINPIWVIAIVIGIAVVGMTLFIALRFRDNDGKRSPKQTHGNSVLEIGWTILPALLLAVIAVPTIATIFKLAEKAPRDEAIQITAVGKQWWWEFQYASNQPKFGIDRKIVTSTMMHVPVGAKITLREQLLEHDLGEIQARKEQQFKEADEEFAQAIDQIMREAQEMQRAGREHLLTVLFHLGDGAGFLGLRDDLFDPRAESLGLGQSGLDAAMLDERGAEIGEHRLAVFAGDAE